MKKILLSALFFCFGMLPIYAGPLDCRALIDYVPVIASDTMKATITSEAVYVNDYKSCNIVIESGVATYTASDTISWQLLECETINGTYTPVLANEIRGNNVEVDASGTFQLLKDNISNTNVSKTSYVGGANYLKVKGYVNGTVEGANKVTIIKTHPYLGF